MDIWSHNYSWKELYIYGGRLYQNKNKNKYRHNNTLNNNMI